MSDISVSDIMAKETSLVVGVVQGAKEVTTESISNDSSNNFFTSEAYSKQCDDGKITYSKNLDTRKAEKCFGEPSRKGTYPNGVVVLYVGDLYQYQYYTGYGDGFALPEYESIALATIEADKGIFTILGERVSPEIIAEKGVRCVIEEKLRAKYPQKADEILKQLTDLYALDPNKIRNQEEKTEPGIEAQDEFEEPTADDLHAAFRETIERYKREKEDAIKRAEEAEERAKKAEEELKTVKGNAKSFRNKVFAFLRKHPVLEKAFLNELNGRDGQSNVIEGPQK